jgi:hypothetical protein
MKKTLTITLVLSLLCTGIFAQNILNNKDTTLSKYLEKNMQYINIDDTCFTGVYNISFSLTKDKKLINFDYSKGLSKKIADKIKNLLIALDNNWDTVFINQSLNKRIIQPLFLAIQNNCILPKIKGHLKLKKYSLADSELAKNIEHTNILMDLANLLTGSQYTFINGNDYEFSGQKNYDICTILKPALIINEYKTSKKNIKR